VARPNPIPTSALNCVLFGYIRNTRGQGVQNVSVLIRSPAEYPEQGFVDDEGDAVGEGLLNRDYEVLTDVNGLWTAELRRDRRVRVYIAALKVDVTNKVPSQNNVDFFVWTYQPVIEDTKEWIADPVGAPTVVDTIVQARVDIKILPMVMDTFEQIKVYRATTRNGVYAEITDASTRLELADGVVFYDHTDSAHDPTDWYRMAFYNASEDVEGPQGPPVRADAPDYAIVTTVGELKEHYLFGVDLGDDKGRDYPKSLFEGYIRAAITRLERELQVALKPTARVERQDYLWADFRQWGYMQTDWLPILEVDSVSYMLGDQVLMEVPSDWIQVDKENGVIELTPMSGSLDAILLAASGSFVGPLATMYSRRYPAFLRITYRHGFGLGLIPPDIKHVISMLASIGPLNIAGDLLIGAGIANLSVSAGGAHQSIGSTSSATNSGYGARIKEYERELKSMLPTLRAHYHGLRARVA